MQFFNYVMRKVWLHQTRIGLSLYDVAGQGYLKESVSIGCNIHVNWSIFVEPGLASAVEKSNFLSFCLYIHKHLEPLQRPW